MSLVVAPTSAIYLLDMGIIRGKRQEQPTDKRARQDMIDELRALVASLEAKQG